MIVVCEDACRSSKVDLERLKTSRINKEHKQQRLHNLGQRNTQLRDVYVNREIFEFVRSIDHGVAAFPSLNTDFGPTSQHLGILLVALHRVSSLKYEEINSRSYFPILKLLAVDRCPFLGSTGVGTNNCNTDVATVTAQLGTSTSHDTNNSNNSGWRFCLTRLLQWLYHHTQYAASPSFGGLLTFNRARCGRDWS